MGWPARILGAAASARAALSLQLSSEFSDDRQDPSVVYRQELLNYKDLQYYGNVTVGGQSLYAVLDTGSIEFVVLSDKCQYWCGHEKPLYHANGSSSYHAGKTSSVLSYGSGQLMAKEAYEKVSVGPISVSGAPFWEVNDANMPLLFDSDFSAIVGLGPIPLGTHVMEFNSTHRQKEAAALLLKKFQVNRFGVCLGKTPGAQGYFTWNDDSYTKPGHQFTQITISETGYWMVQLTDVRLGTELIACEEGCGAVVDSGTSLLALPEASCNTMEEKLEAFKDSCSDLTVIPDLRFKLAGQQFSLPADAFMGNVVGEVASAVANHFSNARFKHGRLQKSAGDVAVGAVVQNSSQGQSQCDVALMHITMDSSFGKVWILGAPFFRKYYSVFVQGSDGSDGHKASPPQLHTALANEECMPMQDGEDKEQALMGHVVHSARKVDASGLHLPPWVHRAKHLGHLEENKHLRGREDFETFSGQSLHNY